MPIIHSNLLNSDLNWTTQEVDTGKKYLKWEEINLTWDNLHMTWDEIFILIEVVKKFGGSGGYSYKEYVDGNPWKQVRESFTEEDTNKVIKIYCRINGIDYEQVKEPINEIKISVNEFKRFINDVIDVKVKF